MNSQVRTIKVLVFLVAAMTAGAFVLMTLDRKNISAGPFSLSSYTQLNPIAQVATGPVDASEAKWSRIEVFYSNTAEGSLSSLAESEGVGSPYDLNFHLVVFNGHGDQDGQIAATNKWKRQLSPVPSKSWVGSSGTIRVCVVADGISHHPTDSQIKRTAGLVESLSRECNISSEHIRYPANWQF